MGRNIFYEAFGMKRTKWAIMIILGLVVFTLLFSGAYSAFYGKFLMGSYKGLLYIPAKILAVLIIMIMVSIWNT